MAFLYAILTKLEHQDSCFMNAYFIPQLLQFNILIWSQLICNSIVLAL